MQIISIKIFLNYLVKLLLLWHFWTVFAAICLSLVVSRSPVPAALEGSSWTAVSEPSADQLRHSCVQDFCLWEMARLWGCRTFFQDCQLKLSVRIAWEYCHSSHGTCPCDQFPWQGVQALVQLFIDSFFLPVDMEPRASCMPGICCTTVPDLTPVQLIF
jgi:hypothetical protein